ncbi:MAG: hypothetical protein IT385_15000 [Deltaproteobacteria bacterium]|nr:hypothetical protein [Deltaproteobacteria bacterium]
MKMTQLMTGAALALAFTTVGGARAQTADCDLTAGQVDLFVHVRFEDFVGCGGTTGVACSQGPHEDDLVGWGVTLAPGPGTTGDTGTTDGDGDTAWNGNGVLTNTCVGYGQHSVTLAVPPAPNGYHPDAVWPTSLTFNFTINPVNATTGQTVERFFLGISLGCGCSGDGVFCTLDSCLNGDCPYPPAPYDPSRPELCNDQDDDCDGLVDEGLPPTAPACTQASSIGCADRTREGYMAWDDYPLIAACGGAWSGSGGDGLLAPPGCSRAAGNHGTNSAGTGCRAADLCPAGWHVCYGPDDVAQRVGAAGCDDAVDPLYPNFGSGAVDTLELSVPPGGAFFATRAQADLLSCEDGVSAGGLLGAARVFGCGNMGGLLAPPGCGLFDRQASALCAALRNLEALPADNPATDYGYAEPGEWAWSCGATPGQEQVNLVKILPDRQGGVLCCKDSDPSLTEVCDGLDNDADGLTDEVLREGEGVVEAGETCLAGGQCGTLTCTPNGDWSCDDLHACADTTCDDVDDDQDGVTDDDYVETPTICGLGACARSGTLSCEDGDEVDSCEAGARVEPTDTTCDGQDGDCDGDTDEDFDAATTTCGVGACASTGVRTCSQAGVPGDTCVPLAPASSADGTCDGIDDDCDGTDDDDYITSGTTCGVGACASSGQRTCVDGDEVDSCTPGTPAASDATCDGQDDDCDGTDDDDFVSTTTTCGVGVCAGNNGATTCTDGVPGDSCNPLQGSTAETCNGSDDDCDGETDDGFGVGAACDGDDADACQDGVIACGTSGEATCDEDGPGKVEACDGQDNDCDGETDEGLEASGCSDRDDDSIPDQLDNCVDTPNTDQSDKDGDGLGDVCDVLAQGGACAGGGGSTGLALLVVLVLWGALGPIAARLRRRAGA